LAFLTAFIFGYGYHTANDDRAHSYGVLPGEVYPQSARNHGTTPLALWLYIEATLKKP